MFDLAWSEIALIGVVALIAIGPKDLPIAIKAVAGAIKKARRMASEFQGHVDEMVREADLHEMRDHINDIRNIDIKGKILGAVDSDGSLRRTMSESPFNAPPPVTPVSADPLSADPLSTGAAAADTPVTPHAEHGIAAPEPPPAFIPPGQAISPPTPAVKAPPMIPPSDVPHVAAGPQAPVSQAHVSEVVLPSAALPPVSVPDAPGSVPPVQRERTTLPVTHA